MKTELVEKIVCDILADAKVIVDGADCNFKVDVISDAFSGLRPVHRQQKVLAGFTNYLRTGELHAINVKTYTNKEWQTFKNNQSAVQIEL